MSVAACSTGGDSVVPSPRATAESFIAAWDGGDTTAMAAELTEEAATRWTTDRLARLLRLVERRGAVTDIRVDLGELAAVTVPAAASPAPRTALTSYTVTYDSDAASSPVALAGKLPLAYDPQDGWGIEWDRSLLWPGIEGARSFARAERWPRRGAILDRHGRKLAVGSDAARRYPFGTLAGATVGHLEPRPGAPDALIGASGVEAGYDDVLAGEPATRLSVVGRRGRLLEVVGRAPAKLGRPVKTTLDVDVQRAAENAYGDTVGGAVVIDPRNGNLLAVVSSSPFDPNNYVGAADVSPFNRALSGLYPPGSAMKVVTAAAALEEKVVRPSTRLTGPKDYKGVRNFESGVYPTLDFATAVRESVNTAFAQVAEDLGARRLTRYAERFGFNAEPSLPITAARPSFPFPEDLSDLMWGSIGQAQVLATPLEMATVAATIANAGRRLEPRIAVRDHADADRVVSAKTARILTGLMEDVVESGTGTGARISGLRVAGKTGTAEVDVDGKRKNHAWFVAFAPADDPKVAVAVVSELGGVGGRVAAPLARSILVGVLPFVR